MYQMVVRSQTKLAACSKHTPRLRLTACLAFSLFWCSAVPARAQEPLSLFKNYFVTGDYAVAGVGIRGTGVLDPVTQQKWATATITMSGVPANADVLAAFLYWAALETTSTPFSANGYFNGFPVVGKSLGPGGGISGVNGCWGSEVARARRAEHRR